MAKAASSDKLRAAFEKHHGETEDQVECCFALQDKVWVDGPDREPWEIYTVLDDVEHPAGELRAVAPDRMPPSERQRAIIVRGLLEGGRMQILDPSVLRARRIARGRAPPAPVGAPCNTNWPSFGT